jgi:hypothetical protein
MDRRDDLTAHVGGLACTVCDEPIPADRVRILATRDDLLFLQLDCLACASTTLGFVMTDGGGEMVAAVEREGGVDPEAPPISGNDVLDMHAILEAWSGDLTTLVGDGRRR